MDRLTTHHCVKHIEAGEEVKTQVVVVVSRKVFVNDRRIPCLYRREGRNKVIKADKAYVQIEGNEQIIMAEFVGIIQSIRQVLTDRHGDEIAREKIARAARLAFMEEDELDELLTEALKKELEERGYEVH